MKVVRLTASGVALIAAVVATPHAAFADDFEPRGAVGVQYTDNLQRSVESPVDATIGDVRAGFDYRRSSETTFLSARTEVLRRTYWPTSRYPAETLPWADVVGNWSTPSGHFAWAVSDQYGQITDTIGGQLVSSSRQNVNFFTTGPNLGLPIGSSDEIDLLGRYSNAYYEKADIDNHRAGAELRLIHSLSRRQSVSLNAYVGKVEFQRSDLYPSYDVQNAFARFDGETQRMRVSLEAGIASNKTDADTVRTPLLGLTLARDLTPSTTASLEYFQGLMDAAESFRFDQMAAPDGVQDIRVLTTADASKAKRGTAALRSGRGRLELSALVSLTKDNYLVSQQLDRTLLDVGVGAKYHAADALTLAGSVAVGRDRLENTNAQTRVATYNAAATWRLGLFTSLVLSIDHYRQDSSLGSATGLASETRGQLTLVYSRAPALTPVRYRSPFDHSDYGRDFRAMPASTPVPVATRTQ